jgi:hypothetical protein
MDLFNKCFVTCWSLSITASSACHSWLFHQPVAGRGRSGSEQGGLRAHRRNWGEAFARNHGPFALAARRNTRSDQLGHLVHFSRAWNRDRASGHVPKLPRRFRTTISHAKERNRLIINFYLCDEVLGPKVIRQTHSSRYRPSTYYLDIFIESEPVHRSASARTITRFLAVNDLLRSRALPTG